MHYLLLQVFFRAKFFSFEGRAKRRLGKAKLGQKHEKKKKNCIYLGLMTSSIGLVFRSIVSPKRVDPVHSGTTSNAKRDQLLSVV